MLNQTKVVVTKKIPKRKKLYVHEITLSRFPTMIAPIQEKSRIICLVQFVAILWVKICFKGSAYLRETEYFYSDASIFKFAI